jgi:transposase-like protein
MKKQLILLAVMIILGMVYVNSLKSEISYVDMPCPNCGSTEVLDFGHNDEGDQKCHCSDCGLEFSILNEN